MSDKEAHLVGMVTGNTQENGFGSNSDGEVEYEGEAETKKECVEGDKEDTKGFFFKLHVRMTLYIMVELGCYFHVPLLTSMILGYIYTNLPSSLDRLEVSISCVLYMHVASCCSMYAVVNLCGYYVTDAMIT